MKKFLIVLVLVASVLYLASAVSVSAQSAILIEASTGMVLYEKASESERGMASTTKIMTALIVLESADLDELVTIKQSCIGIEGSSMYLQAGERLAVSDLLYGLMLSSGNDCAVVLADHVAGSQEEFVSLMNAKAKELGLLHTRFENPSGLPSVGHYSTAHDMARLAVHAMQNPTFREIVAAKSYRAGSHFLNNHNRLLSMYNGCDGIKTGFTKASGRCLVTSAVRDGIRLVAVTLNAPSDWNDHKILYDFGFSNIARETLRVAGDTAVVLPVYSGDASKVPIVFGANLDAVITHDDSQNIEVLFHLPRFLYAPISKGDVIGTAVLQVRGETVTTVPLIAGETVRTLAPKGFMHKFLYSIRKRFLG